MRRAAVAAALACALAAPSAARAGEYRNDDLGLRVSFPGRFDVKWRAGLLSVTQRAADHEVSLIVTGDEGAPALERNSFLAGWLPDLARAPWQDGRTPGSRVLALEGTRAGVPVDGEVRAQRIGALIVTLTAVGPKGGPLGRGGRDSARFFASFQAGKRAHERYVDRHAGFELALPPGWHVLRHPKKRDLLLIPFAAGQPNGVVRPSKLITPGEARRPDALTRVTQHLFAPGSLLGPGKVERRVFERGVAFDVRFEQLVDGKRAQARMRLLALPSRVYQLLVVVPERCPLADAEALMDGLRPL